MESRSKHKEEPKAHKKLGKNNSENKTSRDSNNRKGVVLVSFDEETEESVPISSERNSEKLYKFSDLNDNDRASEIQEAINALNISQAKLKRIFNYHVKTTHNRIEFSEFLKF